MAHKSAKASGKPGDGVIREGGDRLGYLGHFRSPKVLAAGHNQGGTSGININPISDPQGTGQGMTSLAGGARTGSLAGGVVGGGGSGEANKAEKLARSTPERSTPMPPPTSTPRRSTVMPANPATPGAPTGRPTASRPRQPQGGGVPRSTRTTGVSGRSAPIAPRTGDAGQPQRQQSGAQQALAMLRSSVGNVQQARHATRSILGRSGNVRRGRGSQTY